jgi:hypothetical protein
MAYDPFVPLRFCQVFSRAWALLVERKDLFLLIAVLCYIPNVLLYSILPATLTKTAKDAAATADDGGAADGTAAGQEALSGAYFSPMVLLGIFLTTVLGIIAKAAIVVAVAAMYNNQGGSGGRRPEFVWCFRQVLSHFCGLACAFLCTIFGGALCLGIAAPIVMFMWVSENVILRILAVLIAMAATAAYLYLILALAMLVPAVMIERKGPIHGVKRSLALLGKGFCLVFGTLLLLFLAGLGISNAMSHIPVHGFLGAVVKNLPSLFLLPYDAILTTVVYLNIRITREGLNQEVLAQELNVEASPLDALVNDDVEANKDDTEGTEML